jgi:Co/Zn/Cd efflux system component
MRIVCVQVLLVGHAFHPMQTLKLIGPAAVVSLGAMSAAVEYPAMVRNGALAIVVKNLPLFLVAASLGLLVNLISLYIIKASGATSIKVCCLGQCMSISRADASFLNAGWVQAHICI